MVEWHSGKIWYNGQVEENQSVDNSLLKCYKLLERICKTDFFINISKGFDITNE